VVRGFRSLAVGIALGALLALPFAAVAWGGLGPRDALVLVARGLGRALDDVGWVLVPQLGLAVGVVGLAVGRIAARAACVGARRVPRWLDPAIESALLLGMLGTISGMVRGFVGVSPDALEPGPLVHSLGAALRSSFVGFGIALVGVWMRERPQGALAGSPQGAHAGSASRPERAGAAPPGRERGGRAP
jgi:hypothetical protein